MAESIKVTTVKSDLDTLKSVILCKPVYFRFIKLINESMRFWSRMGYPPDKSEAIKEHETLASILKENSVEVYYVDPIEDCPYQVFTRDLGFTPDGFNIFMANPRYEIRRIELDAFTKLIVKLGKSMNYLPESALFEGGNVVIYDSENMFLGLSNRTNTQALIYLRSKLPINIIPVKLPSDIIHLDVVFNFPSREYVVLYRNAIPDDVVNYLLKNLHVNMIEVSYLDTFTLAPNFLPIRNGRIIAASENKEINKRLAREGIDVIEIPYREMIKAGGSIRCSTFPLERE